MEESQKEVATTKAKEIIAIAKKRFKLAEEAERENRKLGNEDAEFSIGEQWPADIKADRDADNRPCLVVNRMPQHINQITNELRQNRPAIKVSPVDSNADKEIAEIRQGMIRHIEYDSNADVAYDTAADCAVRRGMGYIRVITEFEDPMSFNQVLKIKSVKDPNTVYLDPFYLEPDASDMNWGFIETLVPKEDYNTEFPNSDLAKMDDWKTEVAASEGWIQENSVRIVEYFYKDYREVTIHLLSNGQVVEASKLEETLLRLNTLPVAKAVSSIASRKTRLVEIKWLKLSALEILEESVFPGVYIPIVAVPGTELWIKGKRYLEGLIRQAKDPQRMVNFWKSNEAEAIALAPRAPYIAAEGQITPEYEQYWANSNRKNYSHLTYQPVTFEGHLVPPPQRNAFEPPVQAITQASMLAGDDIKTVTGQYDSSLGAQSNEISGRAIIARKTQTQTGNYHYTDNVNRGIKHVGRICNGAIPDIYDAARSVRMLGMEGDEKIVLINQMFEDNGKKKIHNIAIGKYDVTISTGPSFETKRQEAVESMLEFVRIYPQAAQVIGDLLAKNMDWPGAQEIAERLKKLAPPGIIEDKEKGQIPPEAQRQIQELMQLVEQLTRANNESNEIIKNKEVENRVKFAQIESNEKIEAAKIEAEILKEEMKQTNQSAMLLFKSELDDLKAQLAILRAPNVIQQSNLNEPIPDQDPVQNNENLIPTGGPAPGEIME